MALNPNQFAMEPQAGDIDLSTSSNGVVSCQVDSTQVTALVAAQAVTIVDSAGGVPKVIAQAANTDKIWGIVLRNAKNINFPALQALEIAQAGAVIYMTSGAAVARGAAVEIDHTTFKVITNAGVNPSIGYAYDKATATDQLIRVAIKTPSVPVYVNQLANVTITNQTTGQVLKASSSTAWVNGSDLTH